MHANGLNRHAKVPRCTHLQPAADSFSVYILPMSPIPIMPTVKPSIPGGTLRATEAAILDALIGNRALWQAKAFRGSSLEPSTVQDSLAVRATRREAWSLEREKWL